MEKKTYSIRQIIAIRAKAKARAAAGETVSAPKAAKPKRQMSEKQMIAWNTVILPSLQAGRARKAAERAAAAEVSAEPVAA